MAFHAIASTGRTATTFLARALDCLPGTTACHEGYAAADKEEKALLPLINLENRQAFYSSDTAQKIVTAKRSGDVVAEALARTGTQTLIDVAYYNPTIASALLLAHPETRLVGIIRELEPFVRSATTLEGEDPLPVGWPKPDKPLSPREKFIEMGRIRPHRDSAIAEQWNGWSAIMRNIWLWQETNRLLLDAQARFGERVLIVRFEDLKRDPAAFLGRIAAHFDLPCPDPAAALASASGHRNEKPAGYQLEALEKWSEQEQEFARRAQQEIGELEWAL